jgi:hypothetical protein
MMKTAIGRISGILALTALLSCGDGVGENPFLSTLRIMHLSPDAPNLELIIDGTQSNEASSVGFGSSSAYHGFGVGVHAIQIGSADDGMTRVDLGEIDFEAQSYTVVAINDSANLEAIIFPDPHTPLADTDIRVRAIHAATGGQQIDFLSVAEDGTATELSKNLDFGDFSEPQDIPAGAYTIGIDLDNDLKAEAFFQPSDFPAGTRVNIYFASDSEGNVQSYAQLLGDTTERILPARSSLRVFHASSDAPNIDATSAGAAVLSDLAFGASSDAVDMMSGTTSLDIHTTGTTDQLLSDAGLYLLPNQAHTLVVYGDVTPDSSATALRMDLIADDHLGIDSANLRLQVFHAAAGIEEGDVYSLNEQGGPVTNLVPDLGFGGYGSTPDLPKAKYSVGFEANASGLIIAEFAIPALTIEAANVIIIQDASDAVYLVAQLAGSATALICEASAAGPCALP